jgi:glyoxylate/hydroxypyruvate/2-ketogluconate reductase
MQQKVLITRPIFPEVIERLRQYFDVTVNEGSRYSPQSLREALRDMDGVLVTGGEKFDADTVAGLSKLRAVCISAAGYNSIDVQALTRAGVIAANAPGPADDTTADFAWALMLSTARRLVEAAHWVQEGNWKGSAGSRFFGMDVHGRILGIVGMGRIGQAIARRATGFRMEVLYHNRRRLAEPIEEECNAVYATKEDLLRRSDLVILSLPYTTDNNHLIAAAELQLMRPSAMLFNIARGGLIDEQALAEALREGRIAGAGLDVFEGEPAIHPGLTGLPNVVLTPHIGGGTEATQHGLASLAADNLIAALGLGPNAGRPPSILNPEVLG